MCETVRYNGHCGGNGALCDMECDTCELFKEDDDFIVDDFVDDCIGEDV